jgi:FKBP-type peptidyl-prolyl cis-trans isomerase 2
LAFYDENANVVRVYKVDDKKVYFTYNPELAGKDLIFDITIKEIK